MGSHIFNQQPASSRPFVTPEMVSSGMAAKSRMGYLVSQPKLGYAVERIWEGSLPRLDPALAPTIAAAFQMVADGSSLRGVTAWLQGRGFRGRRGEPVGLATVQRMLSDPFYAGFVMDENGRLVTGRHEAAVSPELFFAARSQLRARKTK